LRPELVVEVSFDHVSGGRFRHGTRLLRFRPDKAPAQCRMDQLTSGSGAARVHPPASSDTRGAGPAISAS
jgi:ATP-dependent DNA ligase